MPAHQESLDLARLAARAADDKKARDLVVYEVADVLALVDCFLLVTAGTERQIKAVADAIEDRIREEHDRRPKRREGTAASGWYLLDYGDVVCHLFTDEQRDFYALDALWSDVDHHDVSAELAEAHRSSTADA